MTEAEKSPPATAPQDRLIWRLRWAALSVDALKEGSLRGADLTGAQYSLLIALHTEPGLSGAELARRLGVTPQAVTPIARRLEDQGLLVRRPHPLHRHVQELHPTSAGRDALAAADIVVSSIEDRVRAALDADEQRQLRTLLDKVTDVASSTLR